MTSFIVKVSFLGLILLSIVSCSSKPDGAANESAVGAIKETAAVVQPKLLFGFHVSQPADTTAIINAFLAAYDTASYVVATGHQLRSVSVLAFDEENPGKFKCVKGYLMSIDEEPPPEDDSAPIVDGWSHFFFSDSPAGVFKIWDNGISTDNNIDMALRVSRVALDNLTMDCSFLGLWSEYDGAYYGNHSHKDIAFYLWSESGHAFKKVTDNLLIEDDQRGKAVGTFEFSFREGVMPQITHTLTGDPSNDVLNGEPSITSVYRWEKDKYILRAAGVQN